jgi:erythromycin esterase-like protein
MGNLLSHLYGEKYLAIGFTYNTGFYSAYGPEEKYKVHPSYVGTYEYYFSKCQVKNFILDLRSIKASTIIDHPAGFRTIGSKPQETSQFAEITLKDHFDVIVYLENSVHTKQLK